MIEKKLTMFPLEDIVISRDTRQRREINEGRVEELAQSIHQRGLIHTILVEKGSMKLIAGERRLEAFKLLHKRLGEEYAQIPGRFASDVSDDEVMALELEENIKREALDWKDTAKAVLTFHDLKMRMQEGWNLQQTSDALGLSSGSVSRYVAVARELDKGNELILGAVGVAAAYNVLSRSQERSVAAELDKLYSTDTIEVDEEPEAEASNEPAPVKVPAQIICEDFVKWSNHYSGPKFNFIHCDFPYGIGWDEAPKFNSSVVTKAKKNQYIDSWETYVTLVKTLCENWNNFMLYSSHMMFWLSGNFHHQKRTREMLSNLKGIKIDDFPLVWHKSDGAGALPEPEYSGRRTYETALHITINKRKIVKAVAMSYAAPTGRATRAHISEKPEPVLRHFFRMYVDPSSRVLDPTCGSGTSIRAAVSLEAEAALGIELDAERAEDSHNEMLRAWRLRELSKEQSDD